VMFSIGCEDMCSAIYPHIDHVTAVDIVVDAAWMCLTLKSFRRGAVVLLVSFLAVFRALSHAPNLSVRSSSTIACVYNRHRSPRKQHPWADALMMQRDAHSDDGARRPQARP
jgi:hypothetical protein